MRWIDALKMYNERKGGSWCVPRKGTPEHAEVLKIMKSSEPKKKKKKFELVEEEESTHLESIIKELLLKESTKAFQVDSGGEDSERTYIIKFDKPKGFRKEAVKKVMFSLIPEHHKLTEADGKYEYEFSTETAKDALKYLRKYLDL